MFWILILILVTAIFYCVVLIATWRVQRSYQQDVESSQISEYDADVVRESDLDHLPELIRKYIRNSGAIGKPRIRNFSVEFSGRLRSKGGSWMNFTAKQFSSIDHPARFFFLKCKMRGLPITGYHQFKNCKAIMDIRALSFVKLQNVQGPELDMSEAVTFLNDICIMAPAALISENISWKEISETDVKALFHCGNLKVSAILQFNHQAELVNFISDDRYQVNGKNRFKKSKWKTPVEDYKLYRGGLRIASYGEAIWENPDNDFCYGQFWIENIHYNHGQIPKPLLNKNPQKTLTLVET